MGKCESCGREYELEVEERTRYKVLVDEAESKTDAINRYKDGKGSEVYDEESLGTKVIKTKLMK